MVLGLFVVSNVSFSSLVSNVIGGLGFNILGGFLSLGLDYMCRMLFLVMKVGYVRYEVEGIGGVMKKILVKRVKVGVCVLEWDEERLKGEVLGREV